MKVLWTDGSASPNPGPGGFAVIEDGKPVILGREDKTTNIRMEGMAIVLAIKYARGEDCEIHTDSEYWVKTLLEWAPEWKKNGWKRKQGKKLLAVKNEELVKVAYKLFIGGKVKIEWTRGHVGTALNEDADKWANRARDKDIPEDFAKIKQTENGIIWEKGTSK